MIRLALIGILLSGAAFAGPESSLRPTPRADRLVFEPSGSIQAPSRSDAGETAATRGEGPAASLRPVVRSPKLETAAKTRRELLVKGAVCGDVSIQGKAIGRVKPKLDGCGVEDAVQVQSVAGVRLSQAAVMDCVTANTNLH
jgi:hypothetical protein